MKEKYPYLLALAYVDGNTNVRLTSSALWSIQVHLVNCWQRSLEIQPPDLQ